MIHGKKIVVVMPAYNAGATLRTTYQEIPHEYVDEVILVDDRSRDNTVAVAEELGVQTLVHRENMGYGANQKTCYRTALDRGADVVVMLHPDYQYTPKLLVAMASLVAIEQYDAVLGSRILSDGALVGGMPVHKYIANRVLTFIQNLLLGKKLSEYHTGYRAFSRRVLESLPLEENGDGFIFDNQMLSQIIFWGYSIGEISCPTRYFAEASSINLRDSIVYGLGVLHTSVHFRMSKLKLARPAIFNPEGRRLEL